MQAADGGKERDATMKASMLPRLLLLSSLLLVLGGPGAVGGEAPSPSDLPEILKHFDEAQENIRSLSASFTERKHLSLLARPVHSQGTFLYARPGRIKWEYAEPEPRTFLITESHFLAYYPLQKRAEEVPLGRLTGRRVFRVFGIGQSAEDLGKFFDIALADPGDQKGTHLLVLTPKRRRVKDRLQQVRFWVESTSYLPRQLEYVEADGDSTLLVFSNIRVNPDIAEGRFAVEIPKDVPITNTFSGFTGGAASR